MDHIAQISPLYFGVSLFLVGSTFTGLWFLDHKTHLKIWQTDITDGELRTHRMILYASYGLLASLIAMAWWSWEALPFFLGCWVTRTVHEFMDELHWHLPRCTERETLYHLGMWVSLHAGTILMFIWGFFLNYKGALDLPMPLQAGIILMIAMMLWIGHHELNDYKIPRKSNP